MKSPTRSRLSRKRFAETGDADSASPAFGHPTAITGIRSANAIATLYRRVKP
jgi:hypothetical protein